MQECGHSGGTAFALGKKALGGSLGLVECLPVWNQWAGTWGQPLSLVNMWFQLCLEAVCREGWGRSCCAFLGRQVRQPAIPGAMFQCVLLWWVGLKDR